MIFAVLLGILVPASNSENVSKMVSFQDSVQSFSNIVNTYRVELEQKLKSEELRNAIDMLDSSMLGFHGTAKTYLDGIRSLNSNASLAYHKSRDLVLEGCSSMSSSLGLFVDNKQSNLSESDNHKIWNITLRALRSGANKINESLTQLEKAQDTRRFLKERLENMDTELKYDLMNRTKAEETEIPSTSWVKKMWGTIRKYLNRVVERIFDNEPDYHENAEDNQIKVTNIDKNIKNTMLIMESSPNLDFAEDKTKMNELSLVVSEGNQVS